MNPTDHDPELAEQTPFDLLGGEAVVRAIAAAFYDHMEAHEPALARTHALDPDGRILPSVREHFASFLVMWTGGPVDYLEQRGHPRLRARHAHVPIGPALRDAWLRCMNAALDQNAIAGPVREMLDARFRHVAHFLQNT